MQDRLNNSKLIRYLLLIAFGWAVTQIVAYFATILITFIFAAILAFLLNYPVRWLKNFLPHSVAVCLVFLVSLLSFIVITFTLGFTVLSQGQQIIEQLPELLDYLLLLGERLNDFSERLNIPLDLELIQTQIRDYTLSQIGVTLASLPRIITNLVDLIIIAVVAFFMLLDGAKLWYFLLKIFPSDFHDKLTVAVKHNFLGFFWGRLILSVFFGVSVFLVFLWFQIPYALALAAIGGVFDLIPGIGATLGISIVALIVLPQGIWLSLIVLVSCILLQQVEENLLMPRIMQESLDINPVIMFFALLVGARVAGLVGIFLAIPIAGLIINLLEINEMIVDNKHR
ncbi:MAG: AI-2E family transporter [Pleurocapsa sp.]